ncbi:MAG: type II toxin-antitoxin system VapC family toxin [Candidatus Latescibacteria bacterium]|nr:type II toxin-antitoxin system VapC family toxin [Candidatus Latescibacterota bacterium]
MIRYALDTSVVLHWFSQTGDQDTDRALRLRQEHLDQSIELVILDQVIYELIHVLKESRRFDSELLETALASLEYMHVTVIPYSYDLVNKAARIAFEHDISTFAAGAVALGAHLRCQMVTADELVYRKISSLPWTILLANLSL